MAIGALNLATKLQSVYVGSRVILTTKHHKSEALAEPFANSLGADVFEYSADTDRLGTFSGEVERPADTLETVRKKCEWGLLATDADYAVASEGSFGPHPDFGFIPSDFETLYFIDRRRDFHLYVTDIYTETNYQVQQITTCEELLKFAEQALFPSHGLIVRSDKNKTPEVLCKGLQSRKALIDAFYKAKQNSTSGYIYVETDMRAHLNPTRMKVIRLLADKLVARLATPCPACYTPGWGVTNLEAGLPCSWCGSPTNQLKAEIYRCVKCNYKDSRRPSHGQFKADPTHCPSCNP